MNQKLLKAEQHKYHRVDSVIESSFREIIESKKCALINMSLNFCETTIYDKVFLENLVATSALTLYEITKDFLKFCSCCVLRE